MTRNGLIINKFMEAVKNLISKFRFSSEKIETLKQLENLHPFEVMSDCNVLELLSALFYRT